MMETKLREVLLAEDNPTNQMIFHAYLGKLGARATVVGSGTAAVRAFARQAFDVVIMDLQMPVMDGVEAARKIRAMEAQNGRPRTPIMALTADTDEDARDDCLDAGMDAHLVKPATFTAFAEALESLVRKAGKGSQAA
ncbi:response regulator [Rubrimonas cliftonensis]|uniref:Response regulator receiver domain-containing protein n=1 Tax=Rubrimonas cliftonensis TaxID=89524 RepID=A0A1H3VFX2_9RHOB|nr:response regulator [Rubrimonas cliftonensis]SDZ73630.1 Response regulator receiver domain-containing protein [Rubrimonas cliftonensis]